MMSYRFKKTAGFTLVELMVGIAIGLIITAAVVTMFVTTVNSNRDILGSSRLNQDLGTVMGLMGNEVRRSGFGVSGTYDTDGDGDLDIQPVVISGSCILYRYDQMDYTTTPPGVLPNGVIESQEERGFKLLNGIVYMATDGATDCNSGTWEPLTDSNVIDVTQLTITTDGSKCRNMGKFLHWTVDNDAGETDPACNIAQTAGSVTCTDTDTGDTITCAGTPPEAGDVLISMNQVRIVMQGELASNDGVTKKLETSVKLGAPFVEQVP